MSLKNRTSLSQLKWFANAVRNCFQTFFDNLHRINLRSSRILWLGVFVAPLFATIPIQALLLIAPVSRFIDHLKIWFQWGWASTAVIFILALLPSYALLIAVRKPWLQRLLYTVSFSLLLIFYIPFLHYYMLFTGCYLFHKCL